MFKRTLSFDKFILWLSIVVIIMVSLSQCTSYIKSRDLSKLINFNGDNITTLMYYTGQSGDKDINQITEASDDDFSYERSEIKNLSDNTWVKFKLDKNYNKENNVIFLNHQLLNFDFAYIYVDGELLKLDPNENFIYSYIKLPGGFDENQYIYIKLKNLNLNLNFNLKVNKEKSFYLYQNATLIFRLGNIGVLVVMLVLNVLLYITTRWKKYVVHFLFLFCMMNGLFQSSGIQKLVLGFNDVNAIYLWIFMTSITAIYFVHRYFDIKNLKPGLVVIYQLLTIANYLFIFIICFLRISLSTETVLFFLVSVCVIGLLVSIFTFLYVEKLPKLYIVAMVILLSSITSIFLATNNIINWNDFTANIIYLASSMEAVLFTVALMRQIKEQKDKIEKLEIEAYTDRLTKLFNRSYFERVVIPEIVEADQKCESTSMLILDIDHFKNVNDTFGHNVGDVLLAELANVVNDTVRKQDHVIRWGGEEFIIIFMDTDINTAAVIAEKIRETIEEHEFKYVEKITVSIGVAEKNINEDINSWVKDADKALYRSKSDGRNRVSLGVSNILPIKINWSNVLECKNPQINSEHKEMIFMTNEIIEEYFTNYQEKTFISLYDKLLDHTEYHFLNEELILSKSQYPDLEKHKQIHQSIINDAINVKKSFIKQEKSPSEIIEFLISKVVMEHIISEDMSYFKYL